MAARVLSPLGCTFGILDRGPERNRRHSETAPVVGKRRFRNAWSAASESKPPVFHRAAPVDSPQEHGIFAVRTRQNTVFSPLAHGKIARGAAELTSPQIGRASCRERV